MKHFFQIFLLFTLCISSLYAKISVIIPCHYVHFKYLKELMDSLSLQTILPNEVIISLSESQKISSEERQSFKDLCRTYPFVVKIIENRRRLKAGQNRNIACSEAEGDIIITQDADDIPHFQRIEIIKYFFDQYDIDHLMHLFFPSRVTYPKKEIDRCYWGPYVLENIKYTLLKRWDDAQYIQYLHNGHIAFRREIFEKVQWSHLYVGEDVLFNKSVFELKKKTMIVDAFLLIYRNELSSYRPHGLSF